MDPKEPTLKDMLMKHFSTSGEEGKRVMKTTAELYDLLVAEGFEERLIGDQLVWSLYPVIRS